VSLSPLRHLSRTFAALRGPETGARGSRGETLYTRYEFADYIRAGAVDVVQADVPRVGGFTEWLKIAKLAESFNLPVAPHFMKGEIGPPARPGHGIVFDPPALARYEVTGKVTGITPTRT
jgi:L-alanine-DL-glutamate epimerase-like enolase superfamily enzyme